MPLATTEKCIITVVTLVVALLLVYGFYMLLFSTAQPNPNPTPAATSPPSQVTSIPSSQVTSIPSSQVTTTPPSQVTTPPPTQVTTTPSTQVTITPSTQGVITPPSTQVTVIPPTQSTNVLPLSAGTPLPTNEWHCVAGWNSPLRVVDGQIQCIGASGVQSCVPLGNSAQCATLAPSLNDPEYLENIKFLLRTCGKDVTGTPCGWTVTGENKIKAPASPPPEFPGIYGKALIHTASSAQSTDSLKVLYVITKSGFKTRQEKTVTSVTNSVSSTETYVGTGDIISESPYKLVIRDEAGRTGKVEVSGQTINVDLFGEGSRVAALANPT